MLDTALEWQGIVRLVPYAARISGTLLLMKGINRKMCLAYLEKIDPSRRMMRFYAIWIAPTLFGEWAMVREWGRIGPAGAVRENWLESESAASAAGTKLRRQKERRGYRAL